MAFSELYYKFGAKLVNSKLRYTGNIWHYTSSEALKGILTNKNIWFSDRRFLNDPMECSYLYQLLNENENLFRNYNKNFRALLKKIINNFITMECYVGGNIVIPQFTCYLASFSCSKDNLELWNYYTKSQKLTGYAISFNVEDFIKLLKDKYDCIYGKVIYNKDEQIQIVKEMLDAYNRDYELKHGNSPYIVEENYLCELAYILEFYNIFFKQEAYYNEQEYRFVIYENQAIKNNYINKEFRICNDIFIPYVKINLPRNIIKEIMISPSINKTLLQKGITEFKNCTIFSDAKCTISKIIKRY